MREFTLVAPYGAAVYPTSSAGAKVVFNDDMLPVISKWLHQVAAEFDNTVLPEEEMVTCPQCGGVLKMREGVPIFCTLCHGRCKVGKSVAETYLTEHAPAKPRLVRNESGPSTPPSAA